MDNLDLVLESLAFRKECARAGNRPKEPPIVTVAEQVAAERSLADTLDQYRGEWVAVHDHVVVHNAPTLGELREQIEGQETVQIFRVADDPHVVCFF
jgi:uncharacterized protein DUF5678